MTIIKAIALAAAAAFISLPSYAATLLTIDVSDASAVKITATGNASTIDFTEAYGFGFTLRDFFTSATGGPGLVDQPVISSSLVTGNLPIIFDGARNDRIAGAGTDGLNIYGPTVSDYTMNTVGPAFSGAIVVDLSAFASLLGAKGSTGDIFHDFAPSSVNRKFGTWEIVAADVSPVPLPASLPLLLIGFGIFGVMKRREKL